MKYLFKLSIFSGDTPQKKEFVIPRLNCLKDKNTNITKSYESGLNLKHAVSLFLILTLNFSTAQSSHLFFLGKRQGKYNKLKISRFSEGVTLNLYYKFSFF